MLRHELFKNLVKVNKDDRILLLTHDDADGAGAEIVLRCMFPERNIEVVHLDNGVMSWYIRQTLKDIDVAKKFDKIIACDISCNKTDAEYIDGSSFTKERFILLDHHLTSQYLNAYSWGVSYSDMLEDSFLTEYYRIRDNGHSSGTSLMLDYMYFCGIDFLPCTDTKAIEKLCFRISAYDTWDWKTCFNGKQNFKDENLLFAAYGNNGYVETRMEQFDTSVSNICIDAAILSYEKLKRTAHIESVKDQIKFGTMDTVLENGRIKIYDIAYIDDSKYVFDVLDYMRNTYPERDLFIVNYGNGVSIRSDKEDVNVAEIVKKFGGGGHKGAGGFKFKRNDIYDLFEKTTGTTLRLS